MTKLEGRIDEGTEIRSRKIEIRRSRKWHGSISRNEDLRSLHFLDFGLSDDSVSMGFAAERCTPIFGQSDSSGHSPHFGFRAVQQRRPCRINSWLSTIHSFSANWAIKSRSILTGSFSAVSPSRLRDPGDVRIDDHADGDSVGRAQDDVGRLPPHARQLHETVHILRHFAVVLLQQGLAAFADALRFVAKEAGALNVPLQFRLAGLGVIGRGSVLAKERLRDLIDANVGALGRKNRGHQQFQRRAEVERAAGVGIRGGQPLGDLGGVPFGRCRSWADLAGRDAILARRPCRCQVRATAP